MLGRKKFLQGVLTASNNFEICVNNHKGSLFLGKSSSHVFIACDILAPVVPVKVFQSAGAHTVGRSYLPLFVLNVAPANFI